MVKVSNSGRTSVSHRLKSAVKGRAKRGRGGWAWPSFSQRQNCLANWPVVGVQLSRLFLPILTPTGGYKEVEGDKFSFEINSFRVFAKKKV